MVWKKYVQGLTAVLYDSVLLMSRKSEGRKHHNDGKAIRHKIYPIRVVLFFQQNSGQTERLVLLYHLSNTGKHFFMTLAQAILALKNDKEIENFLRDLCTPGELRDMEERWNIAQSLYRGDASYREIAADCGASITTVTRVSRFLKDEPYQGYALVLKRAANKTAPKNTAKHHRA